MTKAQIWNKAKNSAGVWSAINVANCDVCKTKEIECIQIVVGSYWDETNFENRESHMDICKKCFLKGEKDD